MRHGGLLAWGARGRWFESSHPDQINKMPRNFAGHLQYEQWNHTSFIFYKARKMVVII